MDPAQCHCPPLSQNITLSHLCLSADPTRNDGLTLVPDSQAKRIATPRIASHRSLPACPASSRWTELIPEGGSPR
ncbi:hypothetical protein VTN31DRAFT_2200 [Thermomyces dupontii]|uniref:uncharacterized protein n=1 Tax=Talaromyces thermophilus TaxID=28565 RepID=UPI0037421EDA